MKIFGREPALWVAGLTSLLSALAAFNVPGVSAGQAFAVGGLLSAMLLAWTTRPRTPGVFTGVVTAGAAVLAEYGTRLSEGQVAALSGVVLTMFTLITTIRVTPAHDPRPVR